MPMVKIILLTERSELDNRSRAVTVIVYLKGHVLVGGIEKAEICKAKFLLLFTVMFINKICKEDDFSHFSRGENRFREDIMP